MGKHKGIGMIMRELEACGLPYSIEHGKRHRHIRIDGKMIGILPSNKASSADKRANLNVRAQIRRAVKENKE